MGPLMPLLLPTATASRYVIASPGTPGPMALTLPLGPLRPHTPQVHATVVAPSYSVGGGRRCRGCRHPAGLLFLAVRVQQLAELMQQLPPTLLPPPG